MGGPKMRMTVGDYLTLTDGRQELDERLEWVNGEMYLAVDDIFADLDNVTAEAPTEA